MNWRFSPLTFQWILQLFQGTRASSWIAPSMDRNSLNEAIPSNLAQSKIMEECYYIMEIKNQGCPRVKAILKFSLYHFHMFFCKWWIHLSCIINISHAFSHPSTRLHCGNNLYLIYILCTFHFFSPPLLHTPNDETPFAIEEIVLPWTSLLPFHSACPTSILPLRYVGSFCRTQSILRTHWVHHLAIIPNIVLNICSPN